MIVVIPDKCPQDHVCPLIRMCPQKAISQKGFNAPNVDNEKCIECLVCVKNCPYNAVVSQKE